MQSRNAPFMQSDTPLILRSIFSKDGQQQAYIFDFSNKSIKSVNVNGKGWYIAFIKDFVLKRTILIQDANITLVITHHYLGTTHAM